MTYTSLTVIFVLAVLLRTIQSTVETEELSVKLDKNVLNNSTFPEDFLFGVSVSALEHEGAWNVSGKIYNASKTYEFRELIRRLPQ